MHRCPVVAVAALAALLGSVACSSGSGPTLAPDSPIWIETSQLAVTVENRAGVPLTDVSVALVGSLTFTKTVPRIENAQSATLRINEFTSPDGTHLNLRADTPRTVRVTATDIGGKKYDVETGWR